MRKMTDPISGWTLKECINALKRMDADLLEYGYAIAVADRIHDLTRWIRVEERLPTEGDADQYGCVLWWTEKHNHPVRMHIASANAVEAYKLTHWCRSDKPEARP